MQCFLLIKTGLQISFFSKGQNFYIEFDSGAGAVAR